MPTTCPQALRVAGPSTCDPARPQKPLSEANGQPCPSLRGNGDLSYGTALMITWPGLPLREASALPASLAPFRLRSFSGRNEAANMQSREQIIRQRAYELWEKSGRKGDPDEHWFEAERQLANVPQSSETEAEPNRSEVSHSIKEHLQKQLNRLGPESSGRQTRSSTHKRVAQRGVW